MLWFTHARGKGIVAFWQMGSNTFWETVLNALLKSQKITFKDLLPNPHLLFQKLISVLFPCLLVSPSLHVFPVASKRSGHVSICFSRCSCWYMAVLRLWMCKCSQGLSFLWFRKATSWMNPASWLLSAWKMWSEACYFRPPACVRSLALSHLGSASSVLLSCFTLEKHWYS